MLLIEETNAADHYEITKFDLYKDDICLVLTLTYVLMDNFLSLFIIHLNWNIQIFFLYKYSFLLSLNQK